MPACSIAVVITSKDDSRVAPGPIDRRSYKDNAEILAVFIDDPLNAKPGETIAYSTFGYTLISIVLEKAAKLPFLGLLQRDIATPLGLASLGGDAPSNIVPNRVRLRWHHAGAQQRAGASLVVYPKERLSIGLASNLTGIPGNVNDLSARIADAFA